MGARGIEGIIPELERSGIPRAHMRGVLLECRRLVRSDEHGQARQADSASSGEVEGVTAAEVFESLR